MTGTDWFTRIGVAALLVLAGGACGGDETDSSGAKVLSLPMRTDGPKTMDPVRGSTTYDNRACSLVYQPLLQYKYLIRPYELEPLLLEEMPSISDDGRVYTFKLQKGIRFQDDECFPDGKGRELVAADVIYSWKRMADESNSPKSWWLLDGQIEGFDAYREAQNLAVDGGGKFDYKQEVSGLKLLGEHEFQVTLTEPVYTFMWKLAMFQLAVVPREAVDHHGDAFVDHPVGTGPFKLDSWERRKKMVFVRNPTYWDDRYPDESMPGDVEAGFTKAVGTALPIADRVVITMFQQDQPMWLQFDAGKNIQYTQVPAENFEEAFNKRTRELKPEWAARGITAHEVPLLDFIFRGFNMEDSLLGGYTEEKVKLRKAICTALDWEEQNRSFYNSKNIVYDGMIPPDMDGHPASHKVKGQDYGDANIELAKKLLADAGYPGGQGLPALEYYVSRSGNSAEQAEMLKRQLSRLGIEVKVRLVDFSTLIETVNTKKAPFFSFAWSSDYPDAENNLALFYGPNESPGSNHFNYKNAEYDKLYEQCRTMVPSPERTALYEKMRDMVLDDAPYAGSMARRRHYLVQPSLKNFKPTETFYNWVKYLDVDPSARPAASN